jgi:hypothetical protein
MASHLGTILEAETKDKAPAKFLAGAQDEPRASMQEYYSGIVETSSQA